MACRAAVEGSFTRESGVAGFLDTQGEFLRSVSQMNRLLRDYPPEPYLAEAELELAQRVYAKAAEVPAPPRRTREEGQRGGRAHQPKLDREALIGRAWQKLEAFLTGYPADPAADQAAFAAANAQLDLKRYADAAQAVTAYARRYPQSELLDSYWYILAYCDFATGKHAAAIEMCRKVAQAQHLDKQSGRMVDSPNKYRAIYILGQIYQSLGQRGDAIREYRRVEDRIPDAKSSASYFLRKQISLPDCTTLKPGTAAEVELSFRNIAACDVKVYRVDLMKFCEAGQALGDLSQVNLAGIRPLHEASVALRDGKDYCDHAQKLALPLKKEGAYLVVCRGEDLYASGLLLISPLEIESHFDPPTGQVRVFVKDATTGKYLSDVQVKLMPRQAAGVANVVGATDLRGVFVGNCPATAATIVAQAGSGRYAYFASPPPASDTRGAVAAAGPAAGRSDGALRSPSRRGFRPLMDLIDSTVAEKTWVDNGAQALSEFPTNLQLAVSQSQQARRDRPHGTSRCGAYGSAAGTSLAAAGPQLADPAFRRGEPGRTEDPRGAQTADPDRVRRDALEGRHRLSEGPAPYRDPTRRARAQGSGCRRIDARDQEPQGHFAPLGPEVDAG